MPANPITRPNIVFIFSDQQRWDTVDCYRQSPMAFDSNQSPISLTPNLDALAREGVRFEHAFTCQPVCGPARACIQTGRYASQTGCVRNGIALPQNAVTIAHHVRNQGYDTAYLGKWHLASNRQNERYWIPTPGDEDFETCAIPLERRGGWNEYWLAVDLLESTSHGYGGHLFDAQGIRRDFPEGRFRADAMTDWAVEYLRDRKSTSPFFLFISYLEPHHQNDRGRYEGPNGSAERFKNFTAPPDLAAFPKGDWKEQFPEYLGCINSLDENVGRIRAALKERGMDENTVVVYASDHGSHFRTRNGEYKRSCHESSIRIPLIASGPGFSNGRVVSELVSLIDLAPTFLDIAGASIPSSMPGQSMLKIARNPRLADSRDIFIQISEDHTGRALRTSEWKYEIIADPPAEQSPPCRQYREAFLYSLVDDPWEQTNLVGDPGYEKIRSDLRSRLVKAMIDAGERAPVVVSDKLQ